MIHRPTPPVTTESEVLVTSDYQINTTLKERELDNSSTGSLRSPSGEGSTSLIVGVSIAVTLVVLIAAFVLVYFSRKYKRRNRCNGKQVNTHIGNRFIILYLHLNLSLRNKIFKLLKP